MTNSEYFEKNKISFAEAMKKFNGQKTIKSFDEFLKIEHVESNFKTGDLVVLQLNEETRQFGWKHNVVFEIIDVGYVEDCYTVKCLTPNDSHVPYIGLVREFTIGFIDRYCILY